MRTWVLVPSIVAALALASAVPASAQQTAGGRITGQVVDSVAGMPLPGAQVIVPGTALGGAANDQGRFSINNVPPGRTTVRAQRIGFGFVEQTVTVTSGQDITVNFRLAPRAVMLNDVVAVGYGTQRRETITSSISSVSSDQFNQSPARDAASLIAGKIPGLSVTTPTGNPTDTTQITLRGVTTIDGPRNPLVLIDGVPGDLNTVAPQDIDQVSVLKDASAAALYGSRASNGVILITTKKFEGGAPVIRYDGYVSKQTVYKRPDFLTAADYRRLKGEGYAFDDLGYSTDWEKQVMRSPISSRHNLSMSGGSSATNYTGSLNWQDTEGIFQRSNLRSLTGRISLTQRMLNDRLQADVNMLTGMDNNISGLDYGWAWRQALIRNPTDRVYDDNGAYQVRGTYMYDNPVQVLNTSDGTNDRRDLRLHGTVRYNPFENLSLSMLAGTERQSSLRGSSDNFENTNATTRAGDASRTTTSDVSRILELTGTYNGAFRQNHYNLLGGYSFQDDVAENFSAGNYGFPTDLFGDNNLGAGSALQQGLASISSGKSGYRLVGFFGRMNYDWNNQFLVNGSLRYEGNSKFGADHKWGLFPAISAGYRFADQSFMKAVPWINEAKFRVGYGVTGIAPRDPYQSLTTYRYRNHFPVGGPTTWVSGLEPSGNPNPDLRWERKGEINVGVDYSMFRSRLYGSVDVYQRDTRDMLYDYDVPVPPFLFQTIQANVGHMRNKGFELQASYDVFKSRNLSWTTSANFSHNTNRLLSLSNELYAVPDFQPIGGTGEPVQTSTHALQIGAPIGNFYGWKSIDIDSTGAWIILGKTAAGADTVKSIRNAGDADRRILGNGLPKEYLAWNNTVRYHNFDLAVNMRGAFGFQVLDYMRMYYENPTITQYNMLKSAFDNVYGKRPVNWSLAYVSYYVENGDYWKLDNVTLGYTLGQGARNSVLSNTRVYLSGSNLLTLTGYKGMDPEVPTNGLEPGIEDRDTYPTTRTFTAGVNVRF